MKMGMTTMAMNSGGGGGLVLDTATQALITAQGANAFTGATLLAIDNTIRALKAASLWDTVFDGVYFLANPSAPANYAATLFNAVNPTDATIGQATAQNSIVWDSTNGLGWTGANQKYIDTKIKHSLSGAKHTQNSCSAGVFLRTEQSALSTGWCVGFYDGTVRCGLNPRISGANAGKAAFQAYDDVAAFTESATANWTGLYAYNRSAANAKQLYKEGSSVGTGTRASSAPPDMSVKLLGTSQLNWYTDAMGCFAWVGGSLTAEQHASLASIVTTNWITPMGLTPPAK